MNEHRPCLTDRERDVLFLLAKGCKLREVGAALGFSAHAVITHAKHIYAKLDVRSRAEAVYEALQLGLCRVERSPMSSAPEPSEAI